MRRSLRRTFSPPERPTLTSRSLQSITQPFQTRFHEVFGNARILIFYLSIKAWEEKSLPKSHLGWFLLVFDEGKAAKENISIFWFIWPLRKMTKKLIHSSYLQYNFTEDKAITCNSRKMENHCYCPAAQGIRNFARWQSREIHKNTRSTAQFGRNLTEYMSVQHIWNLSWDVFCHKLANLSWNFVTETRKRPSTWCS